MTWRVGLDHLRCGEKIDVGGITEKLNQRVEV